MSGAATRNPLAPIPLGWIPLGWLIALILLPLIQLIGISSSVKELGVPPYAPIFSEGRFQGSTENYQLILEDSYYSDSFFSTFGFVSLATGLIILLALPMAWFLARAPERWRGLWLLLVMVPFWTSFLLRIYAWRTILADGGVLNGLIGTEPPIQFLDTPGALLLGLVYSYLPFMILPLYATLERLDFSLVEAARDLGASRIAAFFTVILPLLLPGVAAGAILVFIPMMGEVVIPALLASREVFMVGLRIYDEFFKSLDWPLAAAMCVILCLVFVPPILALLRLDPQGRALAR